MENGFPWRIEPSCFVTATIFPAEVIEVPKHDGALAVSPVVVTKSLSSTITI